MSPRIDLDDPTVARPRLTLTPPVPDKVLHRATAYWKAAYLAGDGWLRDLTGRGHDARFGSLGTTRVFGPIGRRDGYLRLPGGGGNYARIDQPDVPNIAGDLQVRWLGSLDTIGGSTRAFAGVRGGAGTQREWLFYVDASAYVTLYWQQADGTAFTAAATANLSSLGLSNGQEFALRAMLDVDEGGVWVVRFYYRTDGDVEADTGWTQIGADISGVATTNIRTDTTQPLELGSYAGGTGGNIAGRYKRAMVYDAGTLVVDVDATDLPDGATSFTATTGQTVIVNSTDGADSNDPTIGDGFLTFATDDFLQIADHPDLDGAGDLTVVALVRRYDTPTTEQALLVKKAGTATTETGWYLGWRSSLDHKLQLSDGTTQAQDAAPVTALGELTALSGRRTAAELDALVDGVSNGTTAGPAGSTANAEPLRIGRVAAAGTTYYTDMEFAAAAVFIGEALSDDDLATVARELRAA